MCEECKKRDVHIHKLNAHISSLIDTVTLGTNEPWEYSEPMVIGGATGQYTCQSPFLGSSQWKVDIASSGQSAANILVSSTQKIAASALDYTGTSGIQLTGTSPVSGLAIAIPANSSIPVNSDWYPVQDANNIIYILISLSANAAFVNLMFRQKRIVRSGR